MLTSSTGAGKCSLVKVLIEVSNYRLTLKGDYNCAEAITVE